MPRRHGSGPHGEIELSPEDAVKYYRQYATTRSAAEAAGVSPRTLARRLMLSEEGAELLRSRRSSTTSDSRSVARETEDVGDDDSDY